METYCYQFKDVPVDVMGISASGKIDVFYRVLPAQKDVGYMHPYVEIVEMGDILCDLEYEQGNGKIGWMGCRVLTSDHPFYSRIYEKIEPYLLEECSARKEM